MFIYSFSWLSQNYELSVFWAAEAVKSWVSYELKLLAFLLSSDDDLSDLLKTRNSKVVNNMALDMFL